MIFFFCASLLRGIREKTKRNKKILAYLVVGEKSVLLFLLTGPLHCQKRTKGSEVAADPDSTRCADADGAGGPQADFYQIAMNLAVCLSESGWAVPGSPQFLQ